MSSVTRTNQRFTRDPSESVADLWRSARRTYKKGGSIPITVRATSPVRNDVAFCLRLLGSEPTEEPIEGSSDVLIHGNTKALSPAVGVLSGFGCAAECLNRLNCVNAYGRLAKKTSDSTAPLLQWEAMTTNEIRIVPDEHIPTITVTDSVTVEALADKATVTVKVTSNNKDQKTTFTRRDIGVRKAQQVLAQATLLQRQGEHLAEYSDYKNRIDSTWRCTIVAVDVDNPEVQAQLRDVIARLANLENCVIDGPNWSLSADKQAELNATAQALAIKNAKAKAEMLVAELGGTISGVVQVDSKPTQVTSTQTVRRGRGAPEFASLGKSSLPEPSLEISTEPDVVSVPGTVTVVFSARFEDTAL